jgi:hypothetical protein
MKNWIRSILVIISVLSLAKCEIKFLVDTNFMELNEYVLYLNGFINGTQLYKVAPNIAGCEVSDANLYTSIRDFYIYFNNNTWNDKGILVLVEDVTASFSYMFGNFSRIVGLCKVAPYDTVSLFHAFINYFSSPLNYLSTFTKNILRQPYYFYKEYVRSKILLEQGKPYLAGQTLGTLFKNVVFPELISIRDQSKKEETIEFKDIEELFNCGITDEETIKKIHVSVSEFINNYKQTGNFSDLKNNFMKVVREEDYKSVSSCLVRSEKIAKILLKSLFGQN